MLTLLGSAAPVRAREQYPREIANHLGSNTPYPLCSLCHQDGKTGKDTLVTPFALGMRARGMGDGKGSALTGALDRVRADGVDSDGDGATDIEELMAGSDPNASTSTPSSPGSVTDPQLGCTVAAGEQYGKAGQAGQDGVALVLVAGLLWRRRKRYSGA